MTPIAIALTLVVSAKTPAVGPTTPYPILFVTQVPIPDDFLTVNATFGNQQAGVTLAGRGGDLWIRYEDGTLKNLTEAAGWGQTGFQGASSIAVRDPAVSWDAQKAVFSMAVGAVEKQYQLGDYRFQLYEITGLGPSDTPVITKVANQPAAYNNIMPVYASDERIIFVSDRPRNGAQHLYPQRDEYELQPTNTGLWSLDPASGDLALLDHAPSGDFYPLVDSFGRIIFTRWDHLQRDQQADGDTPGSKCYAGARYGTFNYADESAQSAYDLNDRAEVYPEPRECRDDLLPGTGLLGHSFNQFFPWMLGQDGTAAETLNHIGRHELRDYLATARTDDPAVVDFMGPGPRANTRVINNFLEIAESPVTPGDYYGIDAPEFSTHAAGQVVKLTGAPSLYAHEMTVDYITHRDTSSYTDTPSPDHSGLYRDPLVLSDGRFVAVHTASTRNDRNDGTTANPVSRYDFHLQTLVMGGNGYFAADQALTPGIVKDVSFWNPDTMVSYSGPMWELNPVEVRPRARPSVVPAALPGPESQVFSEAGVDPQALKNYLAQNDLALVVSRDVTTRDQADRQQPFNLHVAGGSAQTVGGPGKIYDVAFMQFYQADQLRGWTGCCGSDPNPGRRVLARPLHDAQALACDPTPAGAPEGGKALAPDGSLAAFVPARRAMSWQLTDTAGTGLVRERYWLSFQPGEVRVCASCHGVNSVDQAGAPPPQKKPQALRTLLDYWKTCVAATDAVWRNIDVVAVTPATAPSLANFMPLAAKDVYPGTFVPGDLDPDSTIVGDAMHPLAFYGLSSAGTLRLVKTGAGRLAIYF